MRFLQSTDQHKELTYNDVFLVPGYSEVVSRMDVDLTPVDRLGMSIPIVVSNMNAVAGRRMMETVTRRGGLVILPQDLSVERIEEIVTYVKQCHTVYETPIVLEEDQTIQRGLNLLYKRSHGAVVVVDDYGRPVGIFTEKDARDMDRYTPLKDVMSRDVVFMSDGASQRIMFDVLRDKRVSILPIVDREQRLKGVVTPKGLVRSSVYDPAVNVRGELMTGVALGINGSLEARLERYRDLGVDVFVLDTAHGFQKKMLDAIVRARAILGDEAIIVAGNVVDAQATRKFIESGVNIVKVGVGPGAMCSTRMKTGVGRPQFSAVRACAEVARSMGAYVWADGGVKHPRDVVLALVAGASGVMIGSWFAGTHESAADMLRDGDGRLYKENFGMASARAVHGRTREQDPFDQLRKQFFDEGISHSRMYVKEGEESVEDIIDRICAGVRSACTYVGAKSLEGLYQQAVVGVQTTAGFTEGRPVSERW